MNPNLNSAADFAARYAEVKAEFHAADGNAALRFLDRRMRTVVRQAREAGVLDEMAAMLDYPIV